MTKAKALTVVFTFSLLLPACARERSAEVVSMSDVQPSPPGVVITPSPEPTVSLPSPSIAPDVPLPTPSAAPSSLVWEGQSGETRLKVTVTPAEPLPGQFVTFAVSMQDANGAVVNSELVYGDGREESTWGGVPTYGCSTPEPPRTPPPHGPSESSNDFEHAYRYGGTYTVKVMVATGEWPCRHAPLETVEVSGTVKVAPLPLAPSNGPIRPTMGFGGAISLGDYLDDQPVTAEVAPGDEDGYPNQVSVDWGDGSAPSTYEYPLSECKDPERTWPESTQSVDRARTLSHTYAEPGNYRLTGTVVSVGCDGLAEQTFKTHAKVSISEDGKRYKWTE